MNCYNEIKEYDKNERTWSEFMWFLMVIKRGFRDIDELLKEGLLVFESRNRRWMIPARGEMRLVNVWSVPAICYCWEGKLTALHLLFGGTGSYSYRFALFFFYINPPI